VLKHQAGVRSAAFSSDGLRLATASDDATARLWSAATGEPLTLPLKHPAPVRHVSFSQDDCYLLTWTDDGTVRVWEADTGSPRPTDLPAHVLGGSAERSPEGRRQLECGRDGLLRLWDSGHLDPHETRWNTWLPIARKPRNGRPASAPAPRKRTFVHSASRTAAAAEDRPGSADGTRDGALVTPTVICRRADERLAVIRLADGLRVNDLTTGEPVTPLYKVDGAVTRVEFSPDGRYVHLETDAERGARTKVLDLMPDLRPAEDLARLAQVLTGHTLDEGAPREVEARQLVEGWRQLRARHPGSFSVTPEEVERWHDTAWRSCLRAGLWAEAVAHLDVLLERQPDSALLWARKGHVWATAGRHPAAAEAYDRAIELDNGQAAYWYRRAVAFEHQGAWHRAARDYTQAAELGHGPPWSPRAWRRRACAQVRLGRLEQAVDDLTHVIDLDPTARTAFALRGGLYGHFRHWEKAALDLARARSLGDDRPWVAYLHALVCLRLDDRTGYRAAALSLLGRAEEGRDLGAAAWAAWTGLLAEESPADPERLLYWAERVRTTFQEPGGLQSFCHTLVGAGLCRVCRWADAVNHLENPPLDPTTPWDWLFLARAHHAEGNTKAARHWLRTAHQWMGLLSGNSGETPGNAPFLPWHQRLEIRLLRGQVEPLFQSGERGA
jgi:tetratricopeptide (TPR) repeat protein